jgi:hypothetical protein
MRAGQDLRQVLARCGVIRAEVLRGIKIEKRDALTEQFFEIVPEIPADAKFWCAGSRIGWELICVKGRKKS